MGQETAIAWAEASHNFWYGCDKVSQGCKHCYAERQMERYGKSFRVVTRAKGFSKPLTWKEPKRIFTCSWSDFFHPDADDWRQDAWDVIRATPRHTWLILTKRIERVTRDMLPPDWGATGYPHVWLGVSVEEQRNASRIDHLARIPAAVRFVSAEPLLKELDLSKYLTPICPMCHAHQGEPGGTWVIRESKWHHYCEGNFPGGRSYQGRAFLDWVIAGGESGPQARAMDMRWPLKLYRQAAQYGIPFFFKQRSGPIAGLDPYLEVNGTRFQVQQTPGGVYHA